MKKHIVIGIQQADGSIIPLPEMGENNSFTIGLTPAHARQRKIKLLFLSLTGDESKNHIIGYTTFKINKNTIQKDSSLQLHCRYIKNNVCISLVDAHGDELPAAMFKNTGKSTAGLVFKTAAGIAWSTAIAALVLYLADRTIPGFEIFNLIGLKLPF